MDNMIRKLAALAAAVVLCMALGACGGSSDAPSASVVDSEAQAAFAGTWEIVAMSDGKDVLKVDNVDAETRDSVDVRLELRDDGSMVFHIHEADLPGTWSANTAAEIELKFEDTADFTDISYKATLEDGTLAIADGSLVMMLEKTK